MITFLIRIFHFTMFCLQCDPLSLFCPIIASASIETWPSKSLAYHAQLSHMGNRSIRPKLESSCPKCIVSPPAILSMKILKS